MHELLSLTKMILYKYQINEIWNQNQAIQFKVKSNFKNLMGNKDSFQIEKVEFHNK